MALVNFAYGAKTKYDAIQLKDDSTLYFCTDTLQIFKGNEEYTKTCRYVSSLPTSGQVQGIVYIRISDFTAHIFNGTNFVPLTKPTVTAIPDIPTDDDIPTTKAVSAFVTKKISDVVGGVGTFVTEVSYQNGVLSVAKGEDPVNTTLVGVTNNPTYDPETRTITLPVFGKDSLVISLGKDAFVESGSYNSETKCLDLVLTSGDIVNLPVEALVDLYTGLATLSTTTTVSPDNKISVSVNISATSNNALQLNSDGLYVKFIDAYTKDQTDDAIKKVADDLATHASNTNIHVTSVKVAEWDAKASMTDVSTAKSEAISTAKSYADDLNETTMSAITWKTI